MLTATPPAIGPTTYITINGMLSTAPPLPPTPQLSNSSVPMLAIPSSIASPVNVVGAPNGTTGPFIFPPTYPPLPPNLCNFPFTSSPFQTSPFFPFLAPTATGLLSNTQGTTPLSLGSAFGAPLPTFISTQQQSLASSMAAFPSSISTNPLINPIIASTTPILSLDTNQLPSSNSAPMQPSLLLPSFPFALSQHQSSASVVSSTPELLLSLPCLGLPSLSTNNDSSSVVVSSSTQQQTSTTANLFSTASSLLPALPQASTATSTMIMTPITLSVVGGTCTSTAMAISTPMSVGNPEVIAVNANNCAKTGKPLLPPIVPITVSSIPTPILTTPVSMTNSGSPVGLESVGYHRDAILDAIDKLRERKARPDFERIACLLKRHQNINPDQTQACLGHLADSGAIVCVDYKGNLSYRNPSKWRKSNTGTNSGLGNPPNISQRLVEAVRRVMSGCTAAATINAFSSINNNAEGGQPNSDAGETSSNPAPVASLSLGCSILQIEQALQQMEASAARTGKSETSTGGGNGTCDLSGSALRICLDREATVGKLAKTSHGRYVLDESGERKKLANINAQSTSAGSLSSPMLMTKKLLPPQSAIFLTPNASVPKFNRPLSSTAMIAPAGGDYSANRLHPLAAKQPPFGGSVSIAPSGGRPLTIPSLSARPFNSSTRRGRPPGTKIRKGSITQETVGPPEKKIRLDSAAVISTNGSIGTVSTLTPSFDTTTVTSFPVSSISTSSVASIAANQKAVPVAGGALMSAPQLPSVLPPGLGAVGPTVFQTPSLPIPNGTACTAPFLTNLLPGPNAPGLCQTLLPTTPVLTAPFTVAHPASMNGLPPAPLTSGTVVPTASVSSAASSTGGADLCNFSASLTGHFLTLPTSGGVGIGMPTFLSTVSCNPAMQPDAGQCPLKLISPIQLASSSASVQTQNQNHSLADSISGPDIALAIEASMAAGQSKLEVPDPADLCSTCSKPSTVDEPFLVCSSCKLMAHPTCLGYWPQFTQRARQSTWQCTDCKSCNVCQQKKSTSELLICDACDGGFHSDCLPQQAASAVDSSQLWVCTDCQRAGYSVATNLQQVSEVEEGEDNPSSSSNPIVITVKQDEMDQQPAAEPVLDKVKDAGGEVNEGEGRVDSEALGPEEEGATVASPSAAHSPSSTSAFRDLGVGTGVRLISVDKSTAVKEEVQGSQQNKSAAVTVGADDMDLSTDTTTRSSVVGDGRSASLLRPPDELKSDYYESPTPSSSVSGVPVTPSTSKWDGGAGLEASRPLDIRDWSMEEVHNWLLVEGFPREAEAFQQQEIDGACLLLMKRMDVLTELGIKLGPAVKIYERIKRLQARCTSPSVSFLTAT